MAGGVRLTGETTKTSGNENSKIYVFGDPLSNDEVFCFCTICNIAHDFFELIRKNIMGKNNRPHLKYEIKTPPLYMVNSHNNPKRNIAKWDKQFFIFPTQHFVQLHQCVCMNFARIIALDFAPNGRFSKIDCHNVGR